MPAPGTLLLSLPPWEASPLEQGLARQTHLADAPTCSKQQVFRGMACAVDGGGVATHWYVTLGLWGFDFSASSLVNSTGSSLQLSDCCGCECVSNIKCRKHCCRKIQCCASVSRRPLEPAQVSILTVFDSPPFPAWMQGSVTGACPAHLENRPVHTCLQSVSGETVDLGPGGPDGQL